MVDENIGPPEAREPEKPPEILTKPLPQILDDMEGNIRAAAEAARRAQEAAGRGRQGGGLRVPVFAGFPRGLPRGYLGAACDAGAVSRGRDDREGNQAERREDIRTRCRLRAAVLVSLPADARRKRAEQPAAVFTG